MAYGRKMKTEHTGAKNGGGAWMRRIDAKLYSRKARRYISKVLVRRAAQAAVLASMILAFPGCALVSDAFTNPTGNITIPRQEFINTYATVKVLYLRMRAHAETLCRKGELDCDELLKLDQDIKAVAIQIEKKIAVPEAEIDWAMVEKLLGALISLVP